MQEITEKIKNNAMISYAFLINLSFLKSKNPNINNNFVKSHTKSALLIHLGFLINIIILVWFNFGDKYTIMSYSLNDIFAISIFLILFLALILGVYKAYNKQLFIISENLNFKNDYKFLDITNDGKFAEKDKLTFILSLIPFIGYIIYPEYKKNIIIQNNIKLNFLIFFIIILLYIFGNNDMANILFLIYIIFIVFYSIYIFSKNEVININMKFIPNSKDSRNYIISLKKYLKNYFTNIENFKEFSEIYKTEKQNLLIKNKSQINFLNSKLEFKLNKYLIYIPIINIIALFNLDSKQKIHILNGFIITLITIIFLILGFFNLINYNYILLLLFPIFFGIGYLKAGILNYELPIFYPIVNIFGKTKQNLSKAISKTKEIKNTNEEISLKVK